MSKFNNLENSLKSLIDINNLYDKCLSSIPDKFDTTVTVIDKIVSCGSFGLTISGHVIKSVVKLDNCGYPYKGILQLDDSKMYTYVYLIWSSSVGGESKCYYTFIPDNKFTDLNDPKNLSWFKEPRTCYLVPHDISPWMNATFTNIGILPAFNGYKFSIRLPITTVSDLIELEKEYSIGTGVVTQHLRFGYV